MLNGLRIGDALSFSPWRKNNYVLRGKTGWTCLPGKRKEKKKTCLCRTIKEWDSLESICLPKFTVLRPIEFILAAMQSLYLCKYLGPERNKKTVAFKNHLFSFVLTSFIADINGCIWTLYKDWVCMTSFWNIGPF